MRKLGVLFIFFTLSTITSGASTTLLELQTNYEAEQSALVQEHELKAKKRNDGYLKALQQLAKTLQDAGNLESLLVVNQEIERIAAEETVGEKNIKLGFAELAKLQRTYQDVFDADERERKASLLAIEGAYGRALSEAKVNLTKANKLEEAIAVDAELKAVKLRYSQLKAGVDPDPKNPTSTSPKLQEIDLSVKEPWPFQMKVRRGDRYEIKATGAWRVFPGAKWKNPGDGGFFLRGRYDTGEPFKVGAHKVLEVPRDGILYLGMNEGGSYENNSGKIKLVIELLN